MTQQPNVLVVMTDQQQATTLGCYGSNVARTPHIDALAAESVVIDGGICNYPACTPARAAFHTGRYPHTTGVRANHIHLPASEITLPFMLRRAGYETALLGKNHVFADGRPLTQFRVGGLALADWPRGMRPSPDALGVQDRLEDHRDLFDVWFGADHFAAQDPEFDALRRFALQPWLWRSHAGAGVTPFPAEACTSAVLGRRGADFIRDRSGRDQPWFLWLSFPDPHNPYTAPEPFASWYDPETVDMPPHDSLEGKPERQRIASRMCGMHDAREEDIRRARALHYGQVSGVDAAVGTVLDALRDSGDVQRTIVLYLTDHGGYVGDHGAWHKAPAFYDCLIRIPMMVSWPGTLEPRRLTDGFVEQVDLMPTLLDFAGVEVPPGVQGFSMVRALQGAPGAAREAGFAEVGEVGDPVTWDDLPFLPDNPLDDRFFPWDGFQETWVGQGKMIRTTEWKYVWYANGDEELYDLAGDPDELTNRAGDPELDALRRDFRDRLLLWTVQTEDQLPVHAGNIYLADAAAGALPW